MKNILKYLWRDKVSLYMLILTIVFAIKQEPVILYILPLFIFRGIIWEGKYVDTLQKYVTEYKYRELLKLDTPKDTSFMGLIFDIMGLLFILFVSFYILFD